MNAWIAFVGSFFNLLGSWCVAIEVVHRFKGYAFSVQNVMADGSGEVVKTPDFTRWELKRAWWMWIGLALITVGIILQMIALFVDP